MTETAILYFRTTATARNTTKYPELLTELKSAHIPDDNKIIFETRLKQYEGFQRNFTNKLRKHRHINPDGKISQKIKHYGLDRFDFELFGNFKNKTDIAKLISFEQMNQTPSDFENGVIGLYIAEHDVLNTDPDSTQGLAIENTSIGKIARMSSLWDFKITFAVGVT